MPGVPACFAQANASHSDLPTAVSEFITRRAFCIANKKFAGQNAGAEHPDEPFAQMKCEQVDQDEKILRNTYADEPKVLATLDHA
jgi:hypothetical protein